MFFIEIFLICLVDSVFVLVIDIVISVEGELVMFSLLGLVLIDLNNEIVVSLMKDELLFSD